MRAIIVVLFVMLSTFVVYAQSGQEVVGRNLVTGEDIVAETQSFAERIYRYSVDSLRESAFVYLRGSSKNGKWLNNVGSLVYYTLQDNRELWRKKYIYGVQKVVETDDLLVLSGMSSMLLERNTGTLRKKSAATINHIYAPAMVGVGTKPGAMFDAIKGYDLTTGKCIWSRQLRKECIAGVSMLNDSTYLVTANGLYAINALTGEGWRYKCKTHRNDYTAAIISGVAAGLSAGIVGAAVGYPITTYYYPIGSPNALAGLCSNVLQDDVDLFFADSEGIVRLNQHGEELWRMEFPDKTASASNLFLHNDTLYMVNFGYGMMGTPRPYGKPFVAAFNKADGQQYFFTEIPVEKKSVMNKFYWDNEMRFRLLFDDRLFFYSMKDGTIQSDISFNAEEFGALKGIVSSEYSYKSAERFVVLGMLDAENTYYYTSDNTLLKINEPSGSVMKSDSEQIYRNLLTTDNHQFYAKGDSIVVVNDTNKEVATFAVGGDATVCGDRLIIAKENKLYQIDITSYR